MSVVTDPVAGGVAFDCQSCGACCIEAGVVIVSPEDTTPRRLTQSVRGRMGFLSDDYRNGVRMMRQECPGGRCVALHGTIGTAVRCVIYDHRPEACRTFDPGSPGCVEAREIMFRSQSQMEWKPRGYDERPLDGPQPPADL